MRFEWDEGNLLKVRQHGLAINNIELAFFSQDKFLAVDYKHSQLEPRYILLSRNQAARWLYIVFTLRQSKIRIISARYMHQKEVTRYEEALKNS